MVKLKGKIFWILGDLKHINGEYNNTVASVTNLTDVIIDENIIKFDWQPNVDFYGGTVNLLAIQDSKYSGSGMVTDGDNSIKVTAEIFENKKRFILRGEWVEDSKIYTWWAEINR